MYDGVFLDLYGTLTAGDRDAVHAACAAIVHDCRLSMSAEQLAEKWGIRFFKLVDSSNHSEFRTLIDCEVISLSETMADLDVQADPSPYIDILEDYWRAPPLHDDVHDALAAFPVPVCIVSNADEAAAWGALRAHRLGFDHVVTSEEARCYKPDAGIFDRALEKTGWHPDRVIHVGDSLHSDINGASKRGLQTGWMCRDVRIHDIGKVDPHHTFRNMHDLASFLNEAVVAR